MSDNLKSPINNKNSIVNFEDIKKRIQNLRTKNLCENKPDMEINKDVLNSFKKKPNNDNKSISLYSQIELLNSNSNNISNINNNSFNKDQNISLINSMKNDKKDLNDSNYLLIPNLKLDRSKDKDSKSVMNNQKFISLKSQVNNNKITNKVTSLKSKLTETNINLSNDKSHKNINSKLQVLSEKLQESDSNNILNRNNLNSLNNLSKELDQSPSHFLNKKFDYIRKDIMNCYEEKKESDR